MGAKNTSNILPFCHPLPLEYVDIKIEIDKETTRTLRIDCVVKTTHKTGVEMEAIIGATHAAVCIYDMLKAVSHNIVISQVKLISKSGGKSSYVDNQSTKSPS
jgi:cyclic pyranopterin monophosphate synthase